MNVTILPIGDNYTYLLGEGIEWAAVDPTAAEPVLRALAEAGGRLTMILNTHLHGDHTAGNVALKRETGARVAGPGRGLPGQDATVEDGQSIALAGRRLRVMPTPGHGEHHVCYYLEPGGPDPGALFTGDLLFVGGCGRLIGCAPEVMWASLSRVAALPPETRVYAGHEYTEENYRFALTIEPDSAAVAERLEAARRRLARGLPTVPTTIGLETQTNVFLRAGAASVKSALGMDGAPEVEVFTELRRRKDRFG